MPPSLRELQLWMKWIVTDPRGVKEALSDPFPSHRPNIERYTSPTPVALPWITDSPPIDQSVRLDIYAEAYFTRVLESMKSDFQITARILCDRSFQKLVSDYLKNYPSKTTNIGEIGRNFSVFVAQYEDLKSAEFLESLTSMEWLLIKSFYADDTGLLEAKKLASLSDEDWENAEFKMAPSIQLLESQWPLAQFWLLRDESIELDQVTIEKLESRQRFLISRETGSVSVEQISAPEYAILQKLISGASLTTALEEAQVEFSKEDIGSQIMTWFNAWVSRGIIYDIKLKKEMVSL